MYVVDQCNGEKILCELRTDTNETINDLNIAPFTTLQAIWYLAFLEISTIKRLLCILTEVQEAGVAPSMWQKKEKTGTLQVRDISATNPL
jgi:hypothetical protein